MTPWYKRCEKKTDETEIAGDCHGPETVPPALRGGRRANASAPKTGWPADVQTSGGKGPSFSTMNNVGKTTINDTFGNGLYYLFVVIFGIVYCFGHIHRKWCFRKAFVISRLVCLSHLRFNAQPANDMFIRLKNPM